MEYMFVSNFQYGESVSIFGIQQQSSGMEPLESYGVQPGTQATNFLCPPCFKFSTTFLDTGWMDMNLAVVI